MTDAVHQVRHIVCPGCKEGYTEFLHPGWYAIDGYDGFWEEQICRHCGQKFYISVIRDFPLVIDEDKIHLKRIILDSGRGWSNFDDD